MVNLFKNCSTILLFNDGSTCTPDSNFLKYANADIDGSILVLKKNKKLLITSKMNERKARALCTSDVLALDATNYVTVIKKQCRSSKVGIDFEKITVNRYLRLKKMFPKRLVDASDVLIKSRICKTSVEIKNIKKAVKITKKIFDEVELTPSMTEISVLNQLKKLALDNGVVPSFKPIVASGKNSANPHHFPTNKKLSNSIVLIDFGVRYNNYCSDMTRCFFLGECKKEKKYYAQAKSIFSKIVGDIKSSFTSSDVVVSTLSAVKKAGWPQIPHAIGHGIGLDVHEPPFFYSKNNQKLQKNMVFAIEPGAYLNNFGVRYESNVLFDGKKARVL